MKRVRVLEDPQAFRLLADGTRRKIVFLLRVKEMTVSQIAAELNVTPQAVYHHIKKLRKAGMIEVAREERIEHLIESYYRATAETFICCVGKTPHRSESTKEQMRTVLNALQNLGFYLKYDENKISELTKVRRDLDKCCGSAKFEKAVSKLEDVDFFTKQLVQEYAETLSMSDEEFAEQQELRKRFRDLLISLVG